MTTITTVSEFAQSVAADIERLGHFQESTDGPNAWKYYTSTDPDRPCCIIANPTSCGLSMTLSGSRLSWEFVGALRSKIGTYGIIEWNETTPTAEVLATLRSL